jgi:hypothetical protein
MLAGCKKVARAITCMPLRLTRKICSHRKLILCLTLTTLLLTILFITFLHHGPTRFQMFMSKELNVTRNNGFTESFTESWQRTGPAFNATQKAVSQWSRAVYPLAFYMITLWYDVLIAIGPPMLLAVSNMNPLVYWVLVGLTLIAILLFLLRRECRKRKIFERMSMAYERRTNAIKRAWKKISDSVSSKSILAAKLLPHLMFVVLYTVLLWLVPKSVRVMLSEGQTIALFAMPLPLFFSTRAVLNQTH